MTPTPPKTPEELNAEFERIAADLGDGIAEAVASAVASAVAENERRIVAWLNAEAERVDCGHIEDLADRIERGEHRREEDK